MLRIAAMTIALCLASAGCARYPGGIAPSNIPLTPGSYTPLGPVVGEDCKVDLLGIIPVSGGNDLSQALEEAKKKNPAALGGALIEITVDRNSKFFILWSQICTVVKATAVSIP